MDRSRDFDSPTEAIGYAERHHYLVLVEKISGRSRIRAVKTNPDMVYKLKKNEEGLYHWEIY